MLKNLPIGRDNFKDVIERNLYYVDKTDIIEEMLRTDSYVSLFPRPRRFGKSLFLSMVDNFFNIEYKDTNKDLFKGLKISKSEYYNRLSSNPVIKLDFKNLKQNNYEVMYNSYKEMIRELYSKKDYLKEILNDSEKELYDSFLYETADISKYYTWDNDTQKYVANEMNYSDCYYQKDGSYYQIDRIVRLSDTKDSKTGELLTNRYDVYVNQVDIRGNKLAGEPTLKFTRKINSNYRLWEVLGGTGSVELDEYTGKFKESENSIKKVSQVACRVGQRLVHSGEATSQSGIFQFMKHSDIHYIVTDGAFKKAPGNLNTFDQLTNNEDLNFIRVNMTYSGIQLDPTHQADNSTVSLMTQVMSALADRGYTKELANQVYSALGEITRESIEPFFDAYRMLLQTNSKDSIVDLISKQIVDSFKVSKITSDNMLQTISLNLYNLIQSKSGGKVTSRDLEGLVHWSENSVSTLINSTVTSTINKLGIRLKTFGSLSVLNPSHGTIQLYGDRSVFKQENSSSKMDLW